MVAVNDLYSTRYFDSKGKKNSGHLGKNDKPEIDIPMLFPLKEYTSERGHVKQSLMAIIQVNKNIALGVVTGKDEQGSEAVYLSLMTDEGKEIITSGRMARAKLVQVLRENSPTTIGRQQIDKASGLEGTEATHSGVSATHFTIKLHDGKLSIKDENSLNGTSVFHNNEEFGYNIFKIEQWSIPGEDTKKLIDAENESKIQS
jgi:hypothetical protein